MHVYMYVYIYIYAHSFTCTYNTEPCPALLWFQSFLGFRTMHIPSCPVYAMRLWLP